jgi:hypothetical protein
MTTVTTTPTPAEPLSPEAYARVFEQTPEGQAVQQDLVRRFARGPVFQGGIDGVRQSDFRAGQRSVIEFIVNRANQATAYPDPPQEE